MYQVKMFDWLSKKWKIAAQTYSHNAAEEIFEIFRHKAASGELLSYGPVEVLIVDIRLVEVGAPPEYDVIKILKEYAVNDLT